MTVVEKIERLILRNPDKVYHSGRVAKRFRCHKSVASKALTGLADRRRIVVTERVNAHGGGPKRYLYSAPKPVYLEIYWPSRARQHATSAV